MVWSWTALVLGTNQCFLQPTKPSLCQHVSSNLNCIPHDNRNFIVYKCEPSQRKSSSWTTLSELKGIDPSPAWYCCYLVISPDTNTVFPLLSLCGGVRGGPLNPSLFAFPSKGLCEECREFNWSRSVPVWLPALLPAHVLGTAELPETGHRSTTPPWETGQNENTFKEMSQTHFKPYLWSA